MGIFPINHFLTQAYRDPAKATDPDNANRFADLTAGLHGATGRPPAQVLVLKWRLDPVALRPVVKTGVILGCVVVKSLEWVDAIVS